MKRLICSLLTLIMLSSSLPAGAYTNLNDGYIETSLKENQDEYVVLDSSVKDEKSNINLVWKKTNETSSGYMVGYLPNGTNAVLNNVPKSLKDTYDSISMRVYSPKATGSKCWLMINSPKVDGKLRYYMKKITVDWVGWKDISYLIVDLATTRQPSPESIENIKLSYTWDKTEPEPDAETALYFDYIKFTKVLESTGKGGYSTKKFNLEKTKEFYDLTRDSVGMYAYRDHVFLNRESVAIDENGSMPEEKDGVLMAPSDVFGLVGISVNNGNDSCLLSDEETDLNLSEGENTYKIDGDTESLSVAPYKKDGVFYLPAKEIAERFGLTALKIDSGLIIGKNSAMETILFEPELKEIAKFKIGHVDYTLNDITEEDFEIARQNLKRNLVGDENNDMSNEYIAKEVHDIEKNAETSRAGMNRSQDAQTLWGEISTTDSKIISTQFSGIYDMAKAYAMSGSKYYKDKTLLADIIYGLDWMSENLYGASARKSSERFGNWWYWMIGAPRHQLRAMMCIYDELTPEQIERYTQTINSIMPRTSYTGGNAAWSIYIVISAGLLCNDAEKVLLAAEDMTKFWEYGEDDTAVYYDGSILEHHYFPYNGGYGTNLINDLSEAIMSLSGTRFFPTDPNIEMQVKWIESCFEPFMYNGVQMQSVAGRSISRNSSKSCGGLLVGMMYMLHYVKPADADYLKSLIKYQAQTIGSSILDSMVIGEKQNLIDILNDESVVARNDYHFSKVYFNMDRIVHYGNGFAISVAMSSERVKRYECIGGDNQQGWYTGDGMVYTYYNDVREENNVEYYQNLDYKRIPGTTTDKQTRQETSVSTADADEAIYDFVGGASLNERYSVGTMDFGGACCDNERSYTTAGITYITDPIKSDLTAKKSYFMFEDEMAALTCGITSTLDPAVETTVDNRMLIDGKTGSVFADGEKLSNAAYKKQFKTLSWASIDGLGGYWFPDGDGVTIERVKNNADFIQIYKEHGKNPFRQRFAYVSLPAMNAEQTKAYAQNPAIEILENSESLQAVRKASVGVTQMVFREAGSCGIVDSDFPCAVIVHETDDEVEIAVAEPTQKLDNGKITLNAANLCLCSHTQTHGVQVQCGAEKTTIDYDFTASPEEGYAGDSFRGITYTVRFRKVR